MFQIILIAFRSGDLTGQNIEVIFFSANQFLVSAEACVVKKFSPYNSKVGITLCPKHVFIKYHVISAELLNTNVMATSGLKFCIDTMFDIIKPGKNQSTIFYINWVFNLCLSCCTATPRK